MARKKTAAPPADPATIGEVVEAVVEATRQKQTAAPPADVPPRPRHDTDKGRELFGPGATQEVIDHCTLPDEPAPGHTIGRALTPDEAAVVAGLEADTTASEDEFQRMVRRLRRRREAREAMTAAEGAAPPADLPPGRPTWQYARCWLPLADFDAAASARGADGWELVGLFPDARRERVGGEAAEVRGVQTFWKRRAAPQ